MRLNKKAILIIGLCAGTLLMQSFAQLDHNEKPTNLKVLPKDISEKELHDIMKGYSKALGVHCDFCHAAQPGDGQGRPKMDFASDAKPEKTTAREMMKMTADINSKYIGKMTDHTLEQINCVTCHMGKKTPISSLDSIAGPQDRH